LAEIAFTATRMSRPFGSGFALSKSISEFASLDGQRLLVSDGLHACLLLGGE
jgi:hypothetical protein